ncbi:MAG: UDP-4-amino-4,6-dideoxy-N-acetyl-beta-L-altrosamine transaminase [Phycisphaerae bacterium]|nr:UDP-4-amino-4,6-dideoxy-N-acetyl-beta-L-altrosamine transaminase [Phycisphaerae bacterium]
MNTTSTSPVTSSLPPLPYARQQIDEADIAAVVAVLRSPLLTQGPKVPEFEACVAQYCGAKHAIAVANGTAALHLAALASGAGLDDLGITSPLTFLASANCIAHTRAAVDFVDVMPETLCLDVAALAKRCDRGKAPKLVVAVDYAGVPAELPRLYELAQRYGFTLIEDAAHALGSSYEYQGETHRCGGCAHAQMATLSFHPVKIITSGEGGMVLTNDDDLARRIRRLACHGVERDHDRMTRNDGPWYHEMHELGFNYRMTDLQAALGLSQMNRLDDWCRRRREIVARYNEAFCGLADIPPWPEHTTPAFHIYVLRLSGAWRGHRRRFFERLTETGIIPQVHYIPVHLQPYYRNHVGHQPGSFPVAEDTYRRCISLPLYSSMSDEDVSRVIEVVHTILSHKP